VGDPITGLEAAAAVPGVSVFHAGTRRGPDAGTVVTSGGRVLGVTALGTTLEEARSRAYAGVATIDWPGMQYRTDIARAAVATAPVPAAPPAASHATPPGPTPKVEAAR
jgi:phosphoribosylamine--glycine ligase